MRTGRAFILSATLAARGFSAFADGTVSPPNPVGEAVWRSHLLPQLLPLAIFMLGGLVFLVQWLVGRIHRQHEHVG
jgi:hypothetical protein